MPATSSWRAATTRTPKAPTRRSATTRRLVVWPAKRTACSAATSTRSSADLRRRTLHALHVEPDRQQVLHVEGVHGQRGRDEVLVLLDLDAVILLLPLLDLAERVVDVGAGRHEEAEVVVAR